MEIQEYEVFKGVAGKKPFLLGIVRGLDRATELMERMHQRLPDHYFIRSLDTKKVVAFLALEPASASARPVALPKEPEFDIFRGAPDKGAVWIETVRGLSSARERMEQIARSEPGKYFVFSRGDHSLLVRTETFDRPESSVESNTAA